MQQFVIENVKGFMGKLLSDPFFDRLELVRMELTTAVTRTVDGRVHKDFFDSEEESGGTYITWKEEKQNFFQAIRGNVLPLGFKIVFRLPDSEAVKVSEKLSVVSSMFLNVNYDRKMLSVVTGISMNSFPSDPSLGQEFDRFVQNVFREQDIL